MISRVHNEDYVVTDRGGIVENRYRVHAAIVDATGKILYAVGDPYRITLHRSAAKPAQTLAILETPGFDNYGLDDADIALMCSSHSSEARHIEQARSILVKVGAAEHHLRCGGHAPLSSAVNRQWIKDDFMPTGICSNCSGKHAGMLGGARALGASLTNYHTASHPMQMKVKRVVEELCGTSPSEIKWAIDGCNLPAPASSLHLLAGNYAFFADASRSLAAGVAYSSQREKHASRIFQSMSKFPEMVGGEGRFCTELMMTFKGDLVGKLGADGCYGIGIKSPGPHSLLESQGAVGIAVKIEDGNVDILYSAVMEILEQLQIGSSKQRFALSKFHRQQIINTVGVITGHVSHSLKVRSLTTDLEA